MLRYFACLPLLSTTTVYQTLSLLHLVVGRDGCINCANCAPEGVRVRGVHERRALTCEEREGGIGLLSLKSVSAFLAPTFALRSVVCCNFFWWVRLHLNKPKRI